MGNNNTRTRNAKLNWFSSISLQIITAISGLILPRIIIPTYGSSINGTIASITQFISYMTLLEAGVGSVFRASLYKPLYDNNFQQVSGIINAQKKYYRKLGSFFIIYIAALCFVYPLIVKTELDRGYIIILILVLSTGTFLEYFVSLPYQSLIIADQMVRLVNILSSIVIVCNVIISIVLVKIGASILAIKISTAIIAVLKPVTYIVYIKRNYNLDKTAKPDLSALEQRKNGMVHHFSYYIHRNTDILLLSVFVGTKTVSIYSVYLAVVIGIEKLITSISGSLGAGVGNVLSSGNQKAIDRTVDTFELIQTVVTTILFSVTAMMLLPFIRIYTVKMEDANYIQPVFGYILIAAEAIYCLRCIYTTIIMNGNKFKETQTGAILESITNLGVSLSMIFILPTESSKLIGIAVGTFTGMTARLIFEIWYLRKDLIYRRAGKALRTIAVCIAASVLSIVTCILTMDYSCSSVIEWIIKAVLTTAIVTSETLGLCYIFIKDTTKEVFHRLMNRG